jgi:hypothetical protein
LLLLIAVNNCWAQQKPIENVYEIVDIEASYDRMNMLLQSFSVNDKTNCFEGGSLYVICIINSNGAVSDVKFDESSTVKCPAYYKQLIKLIKSTSGKWEPAILNKKSG